jgi:formylglycine-generating enzyme required for sulfatase activity
MFVLGYTNDNSLLLEVVVDIQLLVSIFGPALWEVMKTLLEKGRDIALDKGFQPVQEWVDHGYDERKDAQTLRDALLKTLDELKAEGQYDSLVATLKFTGLEKKTHLALAGAAVEMTRYAPEAISVNLLNLLGMDESHRTMLARFLFILRSQLKDGDGYKDAIQYANEMDGLGALRGISDQMLMVADRLKALVGYEEALIQERRLTTDDAQALQDYLAEARQKWEGLMLPLLRKKTGDVTSAKLKQVFVPLRLRDMRAEEEARRKMDRFASMKPAIREQAEEAKPVEIGELLNRYPKFVLVGPPGCGKTTLLSRVALAFAEGRAEGDLGWKGKKLFPIFLRLRNFGAFLKQNRDEFSEPSFGALIAYLENLSRDGDRIRLTADFFDRRLAEGNCLVLMDGLDEVSDLRSEVAGHVDAFVTRYGSKGNYFGLASRPRGYESVERQLRPVGLSVAEVNPLDLNGIHQLMGNLLLLIEPEAARRAEDLEELTRAIGSSEELTRIAGTPLFCSALVQVFKYHGARLPNRRVDVFDEIVDLLLGHWHAQQTRYLSDAEQLAMDDGTGRSYGEVMKAVNVKRTRLSRLALYMQETHQAEIPAQEAQTVLFEYLKVRERVPDDDTAQQWAENFLINSHERSGLLVERDPGVYSFLHKGFMEYLAATALAVQNKAVVDTLLPLVTDRTAFEWWEQVVLLVGAHSRTPEYVREELITRILETARTFPPDSENRLRHEIVAGTLARDMGDDLPAAYIKEVETVLFDGAVNTSVLIDWRASAADTLDELGYNPGDLFTFVSMSDFAISKYPITNFQYERFLQSDFNNKSYWIGLPKFDEKSKEMKETWGDVPWDWLQKESQNKDNDFQDGALLPRYWRDPRFGIARRNAPAVGISWYEASAYCKWLLENWENLDEGKQGLAKPKLIRLPLEKEWAIAAGGEDPEDRYAWDKKGATTKIEDLPRFANTNKSGINRTTPVWMYPQGESTKGVMDMSGNVWEWQANYRDLKNGWLGLRGGSWDYYAGFARVAIRFNLRPLSWFNYVGFRVAVLPSG